MAHEVTISDTGWMFNTPAWHHLFDVGSKRPKSIKEARKVSGITWDVQSVPFIPLPHLQQLAKGAKDIKALLAMASEFAPAEYRAIVRDDDWSVTGTWSEEGVPIRNEQGFEFMEAILGGTKFEALFSIRGGKQVCLLSEFPKHVIVGGDQVRQYLYTRLDHTGAGSMQTMCTNVRVQCANTDRMAVDDARARDGIYRVRHMGDTSRRLAEARTALDISIDYGKQFKVLGDKLAKQKLAERKVGQILEELYPAGSDSDRSVRSAAKRRREVLEIFRGEGEKGDTRGNAPGTKWCLYNAAVEHDQHYVPVRAAGDARVEAERLFVRSTEDPNAIQRRALELITAA